MCILIWFTYYIRACQDYEKIHEVEVKLYKLPKFKIEVEVPSYIYPKSSGVPVKLKGTWVDYLFANQSSDYFPIFIMSKMFSGSFVFLHNLEIIVALHMCIHDSAFADTLTGSQWKETQ